MPTNRRYRRRQQRPEYTENHIRHLQCGHDFFKNAFGTPEGMPGTPEREQSEAAVLDRCREGWSELRDDVLEYHRKDPQGGPATRPWGWWRFEATLQRDHDIHEEEQLIRLGEVDDSERQEALDAWKEPDRWPHFRRCWGWWNLRSPEDRLYFTPETIQLIGLRDEGVLTSAEKQFVDSEPSRTQYEILCYQTRLEPEELQSLGLREFSGV